MLDPSGELIQHRLYRDSCVEINANGSTIYVKDLRILEDRQLEDIVIVDNAVISFAYQIDNGIPILPFREDKEDTEFLHLIKIMKDISREKDCRDFIRKSFRIGEIMKTDMDSYVHFYDMSDDDEDDEDFLNKLADAQRSLTESLQKRNSMTTKNKKKKKRILLKKCKKVQSMIFKSYSNVDKYENSHPLNSEKCISLFSISEN